MEKLWKRVQDTKGHKIMCQLRATVATVYKPVFCFALVTSACNYSNCHADYQITSEISLAMSRVGMKNDSHVMIGLKKQ